MVKAVNRSLHALESQSQNDTGDEKDETKVLRFSGLDASIPRSSFDARIRGFTFAYFTIVMATGGLSAMLSRMPENYRCTGTDVLGKIIFIAAIIVCVDPAWQLCIELTSCVGTASFMRCFQDGSGSTRKHSRHFCSIQSSHRISARGTRQEQCTSTSQEGVVKLISKAASCPILWHGAYRRLAIGW